MSLHSKGIMANLIILTQRLLCWTNKTSKKLYFLSKKDWLLRSLELWLEFMTWFSSKTKTKLMINSLFDHSMFAWLTWFLSKKMKVMTKLQWRELLVRYRHSKKKRGHTNFPSLCTERDLHARVFVHVMKTILDVSVDTQNEVWIQIIILFMLEKVACETRTVLAEAWFSRVSCFHKKGWLSRLFAEKRFFDGKYRRLRKVQTQMMYPKNWSKRMFSHS